jgi:short-subunit dehydrogenase
MQRTVLITGASAGIGRALAFEFAKRGYHLGLVARRLELLTQIREELLAKYPDAQRRIEVGCLDVDDAANVASSLQPLLDALGGVDVVVVNAGVNRFTAVGKGHLGREIEVIQTNLIGAIATAEAAVAHFLVRGKGHLVGISSLASLQGMPYQGAYCASKAGFSAYLAAARIELKRKKILVSSILPGFVVTDIMPNLDRYPFAVSAAQAAKETVALIEQRKPLGIVPAFPWKWLRPLLGHLPDAVWRKLM